MTIAHLSDTHLGFRAYGRGTPAGLNQREADVMASFESALESILGRSPDLVVHAGDFFHVVRPGNATLVRAFQVLSQFQAKRSGRPFILVGGNHDTPRSSDAGNLLRLFEDIPGVQLAAHQAQAFEFPALDLEVLAVPSTALLTKSAPAFSPTFCRRFSVLALHGMAKQALPKHAQFDVGETHHERWTYVALGDYHTFQAYGRNVCYSGATDFTSSNIWEEAHHAKGWVWFDSEVGQLAFVPIGTRPVLDLPPIDAAGLELSQIEQAMRDRAAWTESMPIVRQSIRNFPAALRGKLDPAVVRDLSTRALNYQLQLVAPDVTRSDRNSGSRPQTLEQSWTDHVAHLALPREVTKETVLGTGLALLREVGEHQASATPA